MGVVLPAAGAAPPAAGEPLGATPFAAGGVAAVTGTTIVGVVVTVTATDPLTAFLGVPSPTTVDDLRVRVLRPAGLVVHRKATGIRVTPPKRL